MTAFERAARFYDWQFALERHAIRTALTMVAVRSSDTLLDVGTGTGGVLRELARLEMRPARALGVDRSPAMLARARKALPKDAELLLADATALPVGDASVDVATCAYLLHLLAPHARANTLRELRRVVVPGGRIGVVTVAEPERPLSRLVSAPVRALAQRATGVLSGLRPLDPRDELDAAGLPVEAARRVMRGYPSLCVLARCPG